MPKERVSRTVPLSVSGAKHQLSKATFYPADDEPVKQVRASSKGKTALRGSIVPGTVLIVLAGRFRGKRVVFLKQLESGLLLVTGPYKVNGVPLRRVNQSYVIATKTKVDVSGVVVPAEVNDAFFKAPKGAKKASEQTFFEGDVIPKLAVSSQKKDVQKKVDTALLAALKKDQTLKTYLSARFSLTKGQKPHEMTF